MVWYLEEIPLSFADIPTLKRIDLMRCSSRESLVASALRIKEEVKEIEGCDRIHLNIYVSRNKLHCDVLVSSFASNGCLMDVSGCGESRDVSGSGSSSTCLLQQHGNCSKSTDRVDGWSSFLANCCSHALMLGSIMQLAEIPVSLYCNITTDS
uniref:Uncharacterized protein LOC104226952 isoform X1 n=1 Tax=Nicotiana sylvestris TaxID=4096 RepID=A0A1U7WBJ8_NICSY|nr:PREDICTED: uncharacterized protein LOC104226952 isoform X1 [Nicotiana sylvestris]